MSATIEAGFYRAESEKENTLKTKNRIFSGVFTLLLTSSLIGFASPATATNYTIDCAAPGAPFVDTDETERYDGDFEVNYNSPQAVTTTISVINCTNWEFFTDSSEAEGTVHTADFILVVPANSRGYVRGFTLVGEGDAAVRQTTLTITVLNGFVPNPTSTLLSTVDITLANQTLDLNNSASWSRITGINPDTLENEIDGRLASNNNCRLSTGSANRYYKTQPINIVEGGSYTFRVVNASSETISDTFLALYNSFNTASLDSGLVGCADDYDGPRGARNSFISSGTGFVSAYSYFNVDLIPGNYTAVLTTYSDFAPFVGNETATVELWGPDCGIEGPVCVAARAAAAAQAAAAQAAATQAAAAQAAAADLAARTIGSKKKFAVKPLAKQVGVPIVSSKAKVTFKVAKVSNKVCAKSGSKLKTLKAGNCIVTFTVQEPKPKKGKKPKATKTVKTFVVQ